jgi:site-specific recombinase XerD
MQDANQGTGLPATLRLAEDARRYVLGSRAANTTRAYRSDWADFVAWCGMQGHPPLPAAPETVALYLTDGAKGLKCSTLQRRLASITRAHADAGYPDSPTKSALVRSVWRGIRREKGVAQVGKAPALTADIRVMIAHLPQGKLLGVRDRALLLLGFAGAMRRSELVALSVGDVLETGDGLVVTIKKSKTDPEGAGRKIGIPYGSHPQTCPVRAVRAWKEAAHIASPIDKEGQEGQEGEQPLFRAVDRHGNVAKGRLSDQTVARVVKRALVAAGKTPEQVAAFAGHSLRAGLATSAAMAGASERSIQDQTGHKSLLVLRRYIRDGSLFRENAAARVGL